ncbi:phage tail protein [Pseudomonas sichuanensis]|uniref:phage tail protein n=1 Tax=Pseudomonas TaxID=286 RepID=UPI0036EBA386
MTDYFIGEIRIFAGDFPPVDWVPCDGRLLQINDYQAFYALVGTTYGGDGQSTFRVPDLRGRIAVGTGTGIDETKKPLTPRTIGQIPGTEQVALTASNTPSHSHPFYVTNVPADSAVPASSAQKNIRTFGAFTKDGQVRGLYSTSIAAPETLNPGALVKAGGTGTPHANMMASRAVNYIIAVAGLYPSQN